ncbi:anti-repressor SinI family protein [Aneurinibacillus sp. Ricciae_BoGa-3]|uniref:anti-repressor SinI family protein n=1 Tax=Aneurinibacillus sp. Ricciae_BoGa-3 TaxID=3022697 RepID=UPI002341EF95|nr:anti-repressor SinI family protein [Aneurinibacillus sp. Ricciae_BoGa-3]WCK54267.1 anti-repressor SinI family protein [Aneurinibacillus sp. Ricciae_BoGa-3]
MVAKIEDESKKQLDNEWVTLLCRARELGLTPEEIRHFFHTSKMNKSDGIGAGKNE